ELKKLNMPHFTFSIIQQGFAAFCVRNKVKVIVKGAFRYVRTAIRERHENIPKEPVEVTYLMCWDGGGGAIFLVGLTSQF
ncbi:MAG: hypothetical protein PHD46_04030, partial [Eubacteriales bacterium]|nr:hypothetical protein [Eubacteriales bacterium]